MTENHTNIIKLTDKIKINHEIPTLKRYEKFN